MTRPSRNRILFLTVLAGVGALTAAFAFWYWASGKTVPFLLRWFNPPSLLSPTRRAPRRKKPHARRKSVELSPRSRPVLSARSKV